MRWTSGSVLLLAGGVLLIAVVSVGACSEAPAAASADDTSTARPQSEVWVAKLGAPNWRDDFSRMRQAFTDANPGYDIDYQPTLAALSATQADRIVFVQRVDARGAVAEEIGPQGPEAHARIAGDASTGVAESTITLGDALLVRAGQQLSVEPAISAVLFDVPESPEPSMPAFVRPDWDPEITDVLGGCATETGAYRRILLTWLKDNGPYTFHGLNAHRVRITDSFTHYHPVDGGFDELYLVQMAQPNSRLLTSTKVAAIEDPDSVSMETARDLFDVHPLEVGDLIYIPRGVAHRGTGGALVQVITAPGFRPGAEIGLDHHLKAINDRLSLTGPRAVPFHAAASDRAVVK